MPETDLTDAIAEAAAAPKKAAGDSGMTEQHPISDLIEADRYLASKATRLGRGFKISKFTPGGTE